MIVVTKQDVTKARRGAKYLDKVLGRAWRRKIRRRKLDMGMGVMNDKNECGCILAQLSPGQWYDEYGREIGIDDDLLSKFGLDGGVPAEAWLQVLREES